MRRALLWLGAWLLLGTLAARAIDEEGFRAAAAYSASQRGTTLLVWQHGRKVFTNTANGGSLSKGYKIYSGTKAFWIMAGLAAEQEGILDLDERAAQTITEWAGDPRRSKVTIRQLLNFTSGIEPNFSLHNDGIADRDASAVKTSFGASPGERFMYGPAALQVYHEILARKLAGRGLSPTRYLEKRVLSPLGLGSQRYVADRSGHPLLAAGFILNAGQWLKMGQCILREGAPIAGGGLASVGRGTGANPAFSMAIWNNHLASSGREIDPEDMLEPPWQRQSWSGACLSKNAPSDLLACIGSGGQRLYVVPSQELIVVRQGQFSHFHDAEFLRRLFAGR